MVVIYGVYIYILYYIYIYIYVYKYKSYILYIYIYISSSNNTTIPLIFFPMFSPWITACASSAWPVTRGRLDGRVRRRCRRRVRGRRRAKRWQGRRRTPHGEGPKMAGIDGRNAVWTTRNMDNMDLEATFLQKFSKWCFEIFMECQTKPYYDTTLTLTIHHGGWSM